MRLPITKSATVYVLAIGILISGLNSQVLRAQAPEGSTDASLKTPDSFPRFPPVEPADVAKTFVVQDGFEMQLVAAEPLITDPVAICIDENLLAYVVEMNDYPYTDAKTHKAWQDNTTDAPIGRVRVLEDTDRDGRYDKSTVFAEGLSWPSGILCYKGGVYVTATPDIWYLKDTDGDRRADVREKVFTGFRKYNVQAVMNNPIWGLDNCIYVAGSSNGGSVVAPGQSESKPITARGDFRIDPRTGNFELQAGGARFGNAFDDFGNRFLCNIRNPAIHVVLDNRYLARNPFYAAPAATYNIAEAGDQMPVYRISPIEPWRELRGRQWSADPTKKVPRSELTGGGVFTSTSGINVIRSALFPAEYQGQILVAEVANNVIYRQKVELDGNTFRATRADQNVEFVASTDTWFRPVNIYNAPDGSMLVLDMYREFIEHPWSIPDDIHARLDLTSGRDRGRIYRLVPRGSPPMQAPKLAAMNSEELAKLLNAPSSWLRETAQRLIVERQEHSVVRQLALTLTENTQTANPLGRIHALWTLGGLVGERSLVSNATFAALQDNSPRLREQAVRFSELYLSDDDRIKQRIDQMINDDDSRVRLQVALSLGGRTDETAIHGLAHLAIRDGADPWMRVAICSSRAENSLKVLERISKLSEAEGTSDGTNLVIEQLTQSVVAMSDQQQLSSLMCLSFSERQRTARDAIWLGLAAGSRRKGLSLHELLDGQNSSSCNISSAIYNAAGRDEFLKLAATEVRDSNLSESGRLAAIARLTVGSPEFATSILSELIQPLEPQVIQSASIRALGNYKSAVSIQLLIDRLKILSPAVRDEALALLMARAEPTLQLLSAIESGQLQPGLLGLVRKTQLLSSKVPTIKKRAETILGKMDASRQGVVDRYLANMNMPGDSVRGKMVFMQHCAACHRTTGAGVEIGPHIETVKTWDRDKLLLNILDPNREVAPQSMSYAISLSSGSVISGMIAEETASSLIVKRAGLPPETILRSDVEQMSNSGLSLMPAGFEESIPPQAMADLIAYIQGK